MSYVLADTASTSVPQRPDVSLVQTGGLTPYQLAVNTREMLEALVRLEVLIPFKLHELDDPSWCGPTGPFLHNPQCMLIAAQTKLQLRQVQTNLADAMAALDRNLGEDWRIVGVEHKNTAAMIYRLRKLPPTLAQSLYNVVALTLDHAYITIDADAAYRIGMAEAERRFWQRLGSALKEFALLPVNAFTGLLNLAGESLARAAGGAGEALSKMLWAAIKPLLVPIALVGGGYVLYRYYSKRDTSRTVKE